MTPTIIEHIHPQFARLVHEHVAAMQREYPDIQEGWIESAGQLILWGEVTPPQPGETRFIVQDGQPYLIATDPRGGRALPGPCACVEAQRHADRFCRHRLAVRLWQRSHAALEALITEEDAAPLTASTLPTTTLPEMPCSLNVRKMIGGDDVQFTVRDTDDTRCLQRLMSLIRAYQARMQPAPAADHWEDMEPPAAESDIPAPDHPASEPAPREDWCPVHHVTMRKNDRGYAHKVRDGEYCTGRWCVTHDTRYWPPKKAGMAWSHKISDGVFCDEQTPA